MYCILPKNIINGIINTIILYGGGGFTLKIEKVM